MKRELYPYVTKVLSFSKIKENPLLLRDCTNLLFMFDKKSQYSKCYGILQSFYWDSNYDEYILEFKSWAEAAQGNKIYISSTDNLKLLLEHCDIVAAPQKENCFFIDCLR